MKLSQTIKLRPKDISLTKLKELLGDPVPLDNIFIKKLNVSSIPRIYFGIFSVLSIQDLPYFCQNQGAPKVRQNNDPIVPNN